jgi:heme exporter protein CcmD
MSGFAMTHVGYVATTWGATFALVGGYAAWVVAKGRKLSRQVPPEDRRWS